MTGSNCEIVAEFVALFSQKDADLLAPYMHPDVEFQSYGDSAVRGRDQVLAVWRSVFAQMEQVAFTTLNQAVNGDLVLEEQIHGPGLPGRHLAEIKNMAVYRLRDGQIIEWRDYTNPEYARTLL